MTSSHALLLVPYLPSSRVAHLTCYSLGLRVHVSLTRQLTPTVSAERLQR
ncbi:unnamed protein product [Musa acuminata subsp. malaccensis]|uniref:(wild Malaysian banana) hypothetical protein n=1 Tax=Musa acuminata subsp. malaccensis TaxID=214687 RepID=A0A804IRP0_MUSAM|nr:unnamed protein product [Musa acuminata subsp. malaccensis]